MTGSAWSLQRTFGFGVVVVVACMVTVDQTYAAGLFDNVRKEAEETTNKAKKSAKQAAKVTRETAKEVPKAVADTVTEAGELAGEAAEKIGEAAEKGEALARELLEEAKALAARSLTLSCKAAFFALEKKAEATEAVQQRIADRVEDLRDDAEFVDRMVQAVAQIQEEQDRLLRTLEDAAYEWLDPQSFEVYTDFLAPSSLCAGPEGDAWQAFDAALRNKPATRSIGGYAHIAGAGDSDDDDTFSVTYGVQGAAAKFLGGELGGGAVFGRGRGLNGFYGFPGGQFATYIGAGAGGQLALWPELGSSDLDGPYLAIGFIPSFTAAEIRGGTCGISFDAVFEFPWDTENDWEWRYDEPNVGAMIAEHYIGIAVNFGCSVTESALPKVKLAGKDIGADIAIQGGYTFVVSTGEDSS